ncbi:MAG TPA: hypothetical protein VHQ97_11480 [Solirubrobacterales bacterium]|jgi:hypothetical protein|nr:hypothetical protein [Solirubrobacterales bacterium]
MTQRRTLIVAVVAAGVLYLVGAVALGSPPGASDSEATVGGWFADHHDAARTYAWTATFGTLAFAVFAAIVRGLLPAPHSSVFLLGAAAFIVENSIQAWVWGGLALNPGSLDPTTARALYDVALFWGPVLTGSTMAMIGAVTVLGLGARPSIPRWLTVLGAIAFIEQAVETITVFGTGGFMAPGGDMNLILGAALTLLWLAGLTVWAAGSLNRAPQPQTAG